MNLNIYVAGRFREYRDVRRAIDRLSDAGHTITHDWTRTDEFNSKGDPLVPVGDGQSVEVLTQEQCKKYALMDLAGVARADALVLMAGEGLFGALIEVGAALALDVEVWIVGIMPRSSVFFDLDLVRWFKDIDAVIAYAAAME